MTKQQSPAANPSFLEHTIYWPYIESTQRLKVVGAYINLDWSVIPVRADKAPALNEWQCYQKDRPSLEDWACWLEGKPSNGVTLIDVIAGIAVVCGKVSDNLVVLDFDSAETWAEFSKRHGEWVEKGRVVRTGEGWHVYVRTTDGPFPSGRLDGIDVISDGKYAVLPPSPHSNEETYHDLNRDWHLATLTVENLQKLLKPYGWKSPRDTQTGERPAHSEPIVELVRPYLEKPNRHGPQRASGRAGPEGLGMYFDNQESARAWVDAEVAGGKDRALCESQVRIRTVQPCDPVIPLRPCWEFWGQKPSMVAAFHAKERIETLQGEGTTRDCIDALVDGAPVHLLVPGDKGEGMAPCPEWPKAMPLDPLWTDECVDWRVASIQALLDGERTPDLPFRRMVENIDHFLDLPDEGLAEFLALWVIGTFFRPIWSAYGYLHFDSVEEGCGKTKAGHVLGLMAFWPIPLGSGSTFPELRDSSHFGRTQVLDDIATQEDILRRNGVKGLLHVGYRKGARIRLKGSRRGAGWGSKAIDPFAPRIITSVWPMEAMLRSRTFQIMMRRSDSAKTQRDPMVKWLHHPLAIRDDLYFWAYRNMPLVRAAYRRQEAKASTGRAHELALPILTLAGILERAGETGLFGRTEAVLERFDAANVRDRAEDSGRADLWRAFERFGDGATANQIWAAIGWPKNLSVKALGRQLSGMPWLVSRPYQGTARYYVNPDKLAADKAYFGYSS